ncbi:MAG TPA: hypothetical protein VKA26_06850 [Ignavibacteriaceae bacterium]|nr:hypothetical protein [Ignavibacteriaceae bacterium]
MITKKHYINLISYLLIFIISIPFIADVSNGNGINILLKGIPFLLIFGGIIIFIDKKFPESTPVRLNKYYYLAVILIPVIFFIIIKFIPHSISNQEYYTNLVWLQNYQGGVYPYNFTDFSYNLPVIYYLLGPFYQLGDLNYFNLLGLIIFFLIILISSNTSKELFSRFSAVLFLPLIYGELYSKNDILVNAILFVSLIYLMKRYLDPDKLNFRFLMLAMAVGLLLCTRLLLTIPFILMLLYFFRNNIPKLFVFLLISLLIYFMFIFPFMNLDKRLFILYGPFTNSFATLPAWIYVVILLIVLYAGWMISDYQELLFVSGLLMFISAIFFSGEGQIINNIILSAPFFILSIKEYKIERFTGKIVNL